MSRQDARYKDVKPVLTARARLGEGPVWDTRSQLLYWVDIYNHRVHQFNPATGRDRCIEVGELVSAIAVTAPSSPETTYPPQSPLGKGGSSGPSPSQGGVRGGDRTTELFQESGSNQLLVSLRHGLAYLDFNTGTLMPILSIEADRPHNRFNDGKCDSTGRFWFGSMSTTGPEGALYCYSPDKGLKQMATGLTISNGLDWSPDNLTFYLIDSPLQTIFAYDFDAETGAIANRRSLVDLTHESFFPDGMTIDADGCLWVAMWDGWCVVQFDPEGQEIQRIQLPIQRPTSCTFGGDDLTQLYITSASVGLSEAEIQASFWAGDVFCVDPGVTGLPSYPFLV